MDSSNADKYMSQLMQTLVPIYKLVINDKSLYLGMS